MTQLPTASETSPLTDSYTVKGGITVTERFFTLPLDYSDLDGPKIQVFARHSGKFNNNSPAESSTLPYIVYLQGGPGFETAIDANSGVANELYKEGYQVLWLDQRGTGLSTAVTPDILHRQFPGDQEKAEYLTHFRADNIVRDCEAIRQILLGKRESPEHRKWSIIGQSFGGFCSITYLSFYPEGLKEVYITGGLAPLVSNPDEVYKRAFVKCTERNRTYYEKYPQDVACVRKIMRYLTDNEPGLPNGGKLTPIRFQQLGIEFGAHGGLDQIHQIVLRAANDLDLFGTLSYKLLQTVQNGTSYDGNPIYAILHEAIYCQGEASNWSAARVLETQSDFNWDHVKKLSDDVPIYFLGEMIVPSMFDDYSNLRVLKGTAGLLAQKTDWPALYDIEQLKKNVVPVNAMTYIEDMYVSFDLAQETARTIRNTEQSITNQMYHNSLRHTPTQVLPELFRIAKRERD